MFFGFGSDGRVGANSESASAVVVLESNSDMTSGVWKGELSSDLRGGMNSAGATEVSDEEMRKDCLSESAADKTSESVLCKILGEGKN